MKNLAYEKPTMNIVSVSCEDVVRTSLESGDVFFDGYQNNDWN